MQWFYTNGGEHVVIYLYEDDNYFYVYDSNGDNKCGVKYERAYSKSWVYQYSPIYYHYSGYVDNDPGKPILKNFKSLYKDNENVVFEWEETVNTTHYNIYFDKCNDNGEWERIDYKHYAISGMTKSFSSGKYRALIQATNSNAFTADGSTWKYTDGDWVEFYVGELIPIEVKETSNSKYEFFNIRTTWLEAKDICERRGGHLITVNDPSEQEIVNYFLNKYTPYSIWLGATDEEKEDQWSWITGEPFSYTNWEPGEPSKSTENEDFAEAIGNDSGRWNDTIVDKQANGGFICEYSDSLNYYYDILDHDFLLKNNMTNHYLAVDSSDSSSAPNVSAVSSYDGDNKTNYFFKGEIAEDKVFSFVSNYNGQRLNVYADNVVSGKNVCLYNHTGDASQLWSIEQTSKGVLIRNAQNPYCVLDEDEFGSVLVCTFNGNESQYWTIQTRVGYYDTDGTTLLADQLKADGEDITLRNDIPVKDGFIFKGWTTENGSNTVAYAPGESYSENENLALYAVWERESTNVEPASISLSSESGEITVGDTYTVTATTTPEGVNVLWTSSDAEVAVVNNGVITAVKAGTATITASFTIDGKVYNAECRIVVKTAEKKLTSVSVDTLPAKTVYKTGESLDTTGMTVKLSYNDGTNEVVSTGYSVSGFESATAGQKTLSVNYKGMTASFTVIVKSDAPVDEKAPQIVVESKKVRAGETFDVTVSLKNNPGIASLKAKVSFGDDLILKKVAYNDSIGGNSQQPQKLTSPVTLNWYNGSENSTGDFVYATLTFELSESVEKGSVRTISVTYDPDDVYNINEDNVDFAVVEGEVTVPVIKPGDINGDDKVNNKDLTRLFQYLSDWDVEVEEDVLDVNGDGKVNNKDLTRLFQYLSDWEVEIY